MKRFKVLLVVVVAMLASACDFSVTEMPLPGGADVGENPMTVHVQFPDVLDLVPQSTVKVADVTVGKVTHVELDGYTADVTLLLRKDVDLPDNAEAEIRQTSLLGEKFVSLKAPEDDPSPNKLSDGDEIKISATNRNPEVEEVLGALSLLLNGGGVAQLKTIASELNNALDGRESQAKSVLTQLEDFTGQLDENKADIVDAIESLNRLAKSANAQKPAIVSALDDLPGALESLDSQRADLVKMLKALGRLGNVGTKVIRASKTATIDALTQLQPVLSQLAATGDDFTKSFNVFLTYPFVDEVVGRDPEVARNLHMGDYTNLSIKLDIDVGGPKLPVPTGLPTGLPTDLPPVDPTEILNAAERCIRSGDLASDACRRFLTDPTRLRRECRRPRYENTAVCRAILAAPGDGGGGVPVPLPVPNPLGRTGPGADQETMTLDRLMGSYNPILVGLLLPGVAR